MKETKIVFEIFKLEDGFQLAGVEKGEALNECFLNLEGFECISDALEYAEDYARGEGIAIDEIILELDIGEKIHFYIEEEEEEDFLVEGYRPGEEGGWRERFFKKTASDIEEAVLEGLEINKIISGPTVKYDRGYTITVSSVPGLEAYAVVEDDDGYTELLDLSDYDWEDMEDFLDLVEKVYEGEGI